MTSTVKRIELKIHTCTPSFEIETTCSCAAAALPCRDGTFNVPSIRTPTPWSECPTSVDLLLDLDLEVLEADAIATLDVIE